MKTGQRVLMAALIIGLGMTMAACSVEVERNDDGSLTVTSVMPETSVQEELAAARNTDERTFTADLRDGYFFITVEGENPQTGAPGTSTFHATPSVEDGHLAMTISDARLDGEPLEGERATRWNERLSERLERAAGHRPNRTLQSVAVTDDALTMIWRIETARSRGD